MLNGFRHHFMTQEATALTAEELSLFLSGEPYQALLSDFNGKSNYKLDARELLPAAYAGTLERMSRGYAFLGWDTNTLQQAFEQTKHQLISYAIACIGFFMKQPENDGDFPTGEAPGDDDKSVLVEAHGISPTFLLDKISELYLLKSGNKDHLIEFLKATRMPGAKKYAGQIAKLYKTIA